MATPEMCNYEPTVQQETEAKGEEGLPPELQSQGTGRA